MLFNVDDTSEIKQFIIQQLEPISDADSDVLGDYVLALLRHDQRAEKVRELCSSQLEDFLGEHTQVFIDSIFEALSTKSYKKGADNGIEKAAIDNVVVESTIYTGREYDDKTLRKVKTKPIKKPCYDYTNTGFCSRGNKCHYRHTGADTIPKSKSVESLMSDPASMLGNYVQTKKIEYVKGPIFDRSNTTLVVEKIPKELLSIENLQQYFAQFGHIENVDIDDQRCAAKIRYDSYESAQMAYKSPEPIFNNRFIKVFWAKPTEPTLIDLEAFNEQVKQKQQEHFKRKAKREELKKAQEELMQRKRALFNQQMMEQMKIKQKYYNLIQGHQREDLEKQLSALRAEAEALGIDNSELDGIKPASRPFLPKSAMKLDFRPKTLSIEGIQGNKEEELKQIILQIGPYLDYISGENILVEMKERWQAEKVYATILSRKKDFGEITIKWIRQEDKKSMTESEMQL